LLLVVALVSLSCAPAQPVANVEPESKKVVVFDGGDVTLGEVQQFAKQSGMGQLSPSSPQYQAMVQQIVPQIVEFEIAKAYAREHGITVSESDVNKQIETLKDQVYQQAKSQGMNVSREEAFNQALHQAGLTMDQLRAQVRDQLPVQKVQQQVTGNTQASQEEVQKYYEQNKASQFTTPEQRCVRHILFTKDQKAKAEEVKKQLQNGADFAQLAKQYSQDPGSAEKGGSLGCLGKGDTVPSFDQAIFSAKKGEIVGPIETQFGYHILQVTDIKPQSTQPLSQVEGKIRDQLASDKQSQQFSAWIQKQKEQRDVRYLPGYKPPG
jgi:parvulin-like peptidyl-prolyl isomerase